MIKGVVNSEFPGPNGRNSVLRDEKIERLRPEEQEEAKAAYRKAINLLATADREGLRKLSRDYYMRKHQHAPAGP